MQLIVIKLYKNLIFYLLFLFFSTHCITSFKFEYSIVFSNDETHCDFSNSIIDSINLSLSDYMSDSLSFKLDYIGHSFGTCAVIGIINSDVYQYNLLGYESDQNIALEEDVWYSLIVNINQRNRNMSYYIYKRNVEIESEASNVSLSSVDNINFATGKSIISEILSISSLSVTSPKTSGFDKIFKFGIRDFMKIFSQNS